MRSLLEWVPRSLQEPLENYDSLIPATIPTLLLASGAEDADVVLHYVAGALDHQERVRYEKAHMLKVELTGVKIVERKSGDWVIGKKAEIQFTDPRDNKPDSIMTDWIEFNGYNAYEASFYIALSNTIVEVAQANIGETVLMRKAFKEAETANGGDKVRYAASIAVVGGGQESRKSPAKSSGKSSSTSDRRPNKLPDSRAITRAVTDDSTAGDLYDDLSSSDNKAIIRAILDALEEDKVSKGVDAFLDGVDTRWKPTTKEEKRIEEALKSVDLLDGAVELYIIGAEHLS